MVNLKRILYLTLTLSLLFTLLPFIPAPTSFSTTGGRWEHILKHVHVRSMVINPSNPTILYAGTVGDGVFKSTNGGNSWSAVNTGITNLYIETLAIDPRNPNTLYAGTRGGVFKSTNGGASWSAVNNGLTGLYIFSLAINPLNPSILYAGDFGGGGGTFKSLNGGASWSKVYALAAETLAIDPQNPDNIYAGQLGYGVFKSTDGGTSWTVLNVLAPIRVLAIDPQNTATLYAGTFGYGVFKSTNGGGSWSAVNTGITNLDIRSLAIDPLNPNNVYAGTFGGGVFKSTNGGGSWSAVNTGLTEFFILALAIDPQNPTTVYAGTTHGVFKWIPTNLPPTLKMPTASLTVTSGKPFSFQVQATDAEGDTLSYSLSGAPAGMVISNTGLITWPLPVAGNYTITVGISDGINPIINFTLYLKIQTIMVFTVNKPSYTIDGVSYTMDVNPVIVEGRVMLPVRFVTEPLGASLSWEQTTKKVTVVRDNIRIELWIGNPTAKVNGINTPIDPTNSKVVPLLVGGRTLLPLRFISETLGAEVIWDGSLRTATVIYPK